MGSTNMQVFMVTRTGNRSRCLLFAGYSLSAQALKKLLNRYSHAREDGVTVIAFDDFVSCSVRLRAYTGEIGIC